MTKNLLLSTAIMSQVALSEPTGTDLCELPQNEAERIVLEYVDPDRDGRLLKWIGPVRFRFSGSDAFRRRWMSLVQTVLSGEEVGPAGGSNANFLLVNSAEKIPPQWNWVLSSSETIQINAGCYVTVLPRSVGGISFAVIIFIGDDNDAGQCLKIGIVMSLGVVNPHPVASLYFDDEEYPTNLTKAILTTMYDSRLSNHMNEPESLHEVIVSNMEIICK